MLSVPQNAKFRGVFRIGPPRGAATPSQNSSSFFCVFRTVCYIRPANYSVAAGAHMDTLKTTARWLCYLALLVFVIYGAFISDSKNLNSYALIAMGIVIYYLWLDDQQVAKAREERRSKVLLDRIAYLEQQMRKMEYEHFELEERVRDIEKP
jgi:hypothetical protein